MADRADSAELLDVEVDELAWPVTLVAPHRLGRLQSAHPIEAQALQHPADGGRRHTDLSGNRLTRPALAAQSLDAVDRGLRRRPPQPVRPRTAIPQARHPFRLVAANPFTHRARANAYGFTDGLRRLPTTDLADHPLSTERRQPGILVDVHSALLQRITEVSTTSASSVRAGWTTY